MVAESRMNLSGLRATKGARKPSKRLGLGEGSGHGKTSGRGQKGQKSRTGSRMPRGFEGGQMPIHRRLPKVGFVSRKKLSGANVFTVLALGALEKLAQGGTVTIARLRETGILNARTSRIKVLATGKLQAKLVVEAHAFSAAARKAIEAAGGEARVVSG